GQSEPADGVRPVIRPRRTSSPSRETKRSITIRVDLAGIALRDGYEKRLRLGCPPIGGLHGPTSRVVPRVIARPGGNDADRGPT
ncbi:MAG: hypothetical protein V3U50_02915, partial [Acidimicrobiia bacterium]